MNNSPARALTHLRRSAAGLALALLVAVTAVAQTRDDVCNITTTERVVVIGDIHGAYDRFVALLRTAGLVDNRERWSGGKAVFIQTGDVLDRGPDSRKAIDLLRRLESQARDAGGRVYPLLGNHEFMRLVGDWRYVSAGEFKAFQNGDSNDLRDRVYQRAAAEAEKRAAAEKRKFDAAEYKKQFMTDIPLGYIEVRQAFEANSDYGRWVRERPTVIKVNGVLFMHGGISEKSAPLGCQGVNAAVKRDIDSLPVPPEKVAGLFPSLEDGPLWYRGMASEPEDTFKPTLDQILKTMDARAIVLGHTPQLKGRITPRFGGRVILIDTGMLNGEFFPGGIGSALEIQGNTMTAIYEGRREPLVVPALQTQ